MGLPDAALQEAKERVRAAIRNAGFEFPLRRITVNLAPADVRKQGPIYDLPIAVAILVASRQVPDRFGEMALLGELSARRVTCGTSTGCCRSCRCASTRGSAPPSCRRRMSPRRASRNRFDVRGLSNLAEVKAEPGEWTAETNGAAPSASPDAGFDLAVVQGQEHVKRALEVAAAGGNNVVLCHLLDGTARGSVRGDSDRDLPPNQ